MANEIPANTKAYSRAPKKQKGENNSTKPFILDYKENPRSSTIT